jgi:uncharacterized protein YihD (DUF1040 family)
MPNALYDPARIDEMIELLRAQWHAHPAMRLGQLIVNVSDQLDPFYVEDAALRRRLREWPK